jgi:hypothetical protein
MQKKAMLRRILKKLSRGAWSQQVDNMRSVCNCHEHDNEIFSQIASISYLFKSLLA